MLFLNIFIVLVSIMLAILSRKHYSKYKNEGQAAPFRIWLAMGDTVFGLIKNNFKLDKYKHELRKIHVVSPERAGRIFEWSGVKITSFCIVIITFFNICAISNYITKIWNKSFQDEDYRISREDYYGEVKTQSLYIKIGDEMEQYVINISPMQLSEEEFYLKAEDAFQEIDNTFSNMGVVSADVDLPESDRHNVFSISWKSHEPQIISSLGRVKTPLPKEEIEIKLTATIEYLDFCVERDFYLVIGENLSEKQRVREEIELSLETLDSLKPNDKYVEIPKDIMGYEVSMEKEENPSGKIFGAGVLFCLIFVVLSLGRLKDKVEERDKALVKIYPSFVNKMWLYLGTGMTVKASFGYIIKDWSRVKGLYWENILIREIEYTLNQIDTGYDEAAAYVACGERLGLPIYKKLMRLISQNIKMGTKDLRILMETQVEQLLEERKEYAKKQGEEASTKLIFPMVVLLMVVMVIIMIPAIMGM